MAVEEEGEDKDIQRERTDWIKSEFILHSWTVSVEWEIIKDWHRSLRGLVQRSVIYSF